MRFRKRYFYVYLLFTIVLSVYVFLIPLSAKNSPSETRNEDAEEIKNLIQLQTINTVDGEIVKTRLIMPTILWWTDTLEMSDFVKSCDKGSCIVSRNKEKLKNPYNDIGILFYGSSIEWGDLPLPRRASRHVWALLHEESSKNNVELNYEDAISLFNYTSTFSRYSDAPLPSQLLNNLEYLMASIDYKMIEKNRKLDRGLAVYLHSDCQVPSYRDFYVKELMKYIKIDSYGSCLNNKELPKSLRQGTVLAYDTNELHNFLCGYKFTIAFENCFCEDYVTEKLWRPLHLGSVPIYMGASTTRHWAPSDHSIIYVDDFNSPKELADYILYLDSNDTAYNEYLEFKQQLTNVNLIRELADRKWGIDGSHKPHFFDTFECLVCDKMLQTMEDREAGLSVTEHRADISHYKCEIPKEESNEILNDHLYLPWSFYYKEKSIEAKRIKELVEENTIFV